jgi:hypothetical protein
MALRATRSAVGATGASWLGVVKALELRPTNMPRSAHTTHGSPT